jgi:hypothetical protein
MLRLGWNEHHRAGTDRLDSFRCFDRPLPFDDEVKVLAHLVVVVRRRDVRLVAHHAGEHVVHLRQLLVDEEGPLTAGYD